MFSDVWKIDTPIGSPICGICGHLWHEHRGCSSNFIVSHPLLGVVQDGIAHDAMATGTEFTHGNGKYVYYGYTLKENGLFLPVVKLLDSEAEPFRPG